MSIDIKAELNRLIAAGELPQSGLIQTHVDILKQVRDKIDELESALDDFAKYGVRADLRPTLMLKAGDHVAQLSEFYEGYLAKINADVKERASKLLK